MKHIRTYLAAAVFTACCLIPAAAVPAAAGTLTVTITPGAYWKEGLAPQFAVWVEKTDGTFVATLFVTQRAAKKNWIFAPKTGRPESLPVWYHSVSVDAVSSATPKAADTMRYSLPLSGDGPYVVKIEVNHSFDYNDAWPKKAKKGSENYSGVNGQPSVVYSGTIGTGTTGDTMVPLVCTGTGSVTGSDGTIHNKLNTLTTALDIIKNAAAVWSPAT